MLDCETMPYRRRHRRPDAARSSPSDLRRQGVRLVLAAEIGQVRDMLAAVGDEGRTPEYHRTVHEAVDVVRVADLPREPTRGGLMGQAIGASLALAVGIALSPMPIIAVVLMLTSRRAKINGPAFVVGWLIGLAVVGAIVLVVAGSAGAATSGSPAPWVGWVKIALGALLLLVAVRQFRSRPRGDGQPAMPKWMAGIDDMKPLAALGLAAVLSGANPKNLLLAVGGATAIAGTGIPAGQQALAYLVFALIGTVGVATPVVIFFAMGARSEKLLAGLRDWMSAHNAVIMSVLCLDHRRQADRRRDQRPRRVGARRHRRRSGDHVAVGQLSVCGPDGPAGDGDEGRHSDDEGEHRLPGRRERQG